MTGFPEKADLIIRGGHVLTMDATFSDHPDGAIAVTDGRIVAVGPSVEAAGASAATEIDAQGTIVMPGLINTHCHAAMTLFRGLADDRDLDGFLQRVWAAEAAFITPETVELGATIGAAEMALGGITHFTDMYWHPDATIAAARRIGLSLTTGPVFIGFDGIDGLPWPKRLKAADDFLARHRDAPDLQLMAMPHSCYTLDAGKLAEVVALADRHGCPIHIHGAESPSEMALVASQHDGARPIGVFDRAGLLEHAPLIAHGVHLDDAEIARIAATGAAISHNPLSNAKLASGTARVADMIRAGIPLSLGTDGASSGNDLDLWKAMRLAGFLQALATGNPAALPARRLVEMATCGGARALRLGSETGSLETGKRADIAVISLDAPHMVPVFDPYSALAYSAGRNDVRDVIARGRPVVRNHRLCTDIAAEIAETRRFAEKIKEKA
ncbi:amidohydrolase [Frigidibacter sp. SD6-1]|uniref:amidohydrolase family protein n=1 Tax=Frigidibacter sp. SD6-1 TaxID=3032581 RepID=UPI0024DFD72B|nr:amidohydrolase [Frigidibacter sp. SD6-1]